MSFGGRLRSRVWRGSVDEVDAELQFHVEMRTRELGVRMALGATRRDVVALVVRQAAWPVGIGIGLGVVAAFGATQLLIGQLFEVRPGDPMTFAVVAGTLALVVLAASFIPAARAAAADPTASLRSQ